MDASGKPAETASTAETLAAAPRYQPLVTVAFAVAAGIVIDRYSGEVIGQALWPRAFAAWWCLAAGSLLGWWLAWRGRRDALAMWPLLAAATLAAASWHHARWNLFDRDEVARYANYDAAPACVLAVARETPERVPAPRATPLRAIPGSERSRLVVDLMGIRDGTAWQAAAGLCQLSVEGHLLGVHAGDRLRVFGQLARPRPPLNPGEFDFAAHGRADRQLTRLRSSAPECVRIMGRSGDRGLSHVLDMLRRNAKQLVRSQVGPDQAGLASAILLGAREGLQGDQTEPYVLTGTIHVLVVSGMNVAILAAGLYALMRVGWLPRRRAFAVIMGVVAAYALLAEPQPPVVRAAVLAVLMCIAGWIGRRGVAFNSLAASALIVLAINPADLFRAGPQLSFLAVGALIWIGDWSMRRKEDADPLDQLIAASRPWPVRWAKSASTWVFWLMACTIVVWITALPLVVYRFHVVSLVAVPISPAVWIVVVLAMWSGFFMIVVGWLIPPVGALCGAICSLSLGWLEGLVAWGESLPAGHFWAPGPVWWWVLGFYIGLLAAMIWGRALAPPRWQLATLCVWILVGLAPPLSRNAARDGFECSFVAVGHGACVVLEAPTGETVLYDAGALGAPEYATQTIASYLWHRGIRRIDGVVISHADVDHYNAVPGLLERFRVGAVYVSPMMFEGIRRPGDGPDVLREAIRTAGVPIREIWSGDRLRVGPELTLHVLHPPRRGVLGTDNANSITLAVESGGRRVLLPGDLESPGLEDVMAELPYDCDVLLAPHHGSRRSDPPGFAAWSTPEWVVISGGSGDEVRPVVQTYEEAGASVARTSDRGTVQFSILAGEMKMATWLASPRRPAGPDGWK